MEYLKIDSILFSRLAGQPLYVKGIFFIFVVRGSKTLNRF
jgi:hypothetical protein